MVRVPAGSSELGGRPAGEGPTDHAWTPRVVHLDAFFIDVHPFPNLPGVPVLTDVSWYEAERLCRAVGKRLCTESEWEKTCRGPAGSFYPYGDTFDPEPCLTHNEGGPFPLLGQRPQCASGYGCQDMSGYVNEWTASRRRVGRGDRLPRPIGSHRSYPVLRGGDRGMSGVYAACTNREHSHAPDMRWHDDGFRCCAATDAERPDEAIRAATELAMRAHASGRTDEAVAAACSLVALLPDDAGARLLRSTLAASAERWELALQDAKRAAALVPDLGAAALALGMLRADLKRAGAVDPLARAHELYPNDPGVAMYLGEALLRKNCPAWAAEVLSRALDLNPDHQDGLAAFARAQLRLGAPRLALDATLYLRALRPEGIGELELAAEALARLGRRREALRMVELYALEYGPSRHVEEIEERLGRPGPA